MIDGLRGEYNISTLVKSHDEVITYWTDFFGGLRDVVEEV